MSTTSPRLAMPIMQGGDLVSGDPAIDQAAKAILDNAAIWLPPGNLVNRPTATATATGTYYYATDTDQLSFSDGLVWHFIPTGLAVLPQVRVYNSTSLTITNNTDTAATWDSEDYDLGTSVEQHSTGSNTSRLTCQKAGLYDIVAGASHGTATGAGLRSSTIRLNGLKNLAEALDDTDASEGVLHSVATQFRLAVGDYVELIVKQVTGASTSLVASSTGTTYLGWAFRSA
jgi:hypothetical protein